MPSTQDTLKAHNRAVQAQNKRADVELKAGFKPCKGEISVPVGKSPKSIRSATANSADYFYGGYRGGEVKY